MKQCNVTPSIRSIYELMRFSKASVLLITTMQSKHVVKRLDLDYNMIANYSWAVIVKETPMLEMRATAQATRVYYGLESLIDEMMYWMEAYQQNIWKIEIPQEHNPEFYNTDFDGEMSLRHDVADNRPFYRCHLT